MNHIDYLRCVCQENRMNGEDNGSAYSKFAMFSRGKINGF